MLVKSKDCVSLTSLMYALIVGNEGKAVFGLVGFVFVQKGHLYIIGG